jgi:hypothetical protein
VRRNWALFNSPYGVTEPHQGLRCAQSALPTLRALDTGNVKNKTKERESVREAALLKILLIICRLMGGAVAGYYHTELETAVKCYFEKGD